jgi:hypothetical protein
MQEIICVQRDVAAAYEEQAQSFERCRMRGMWKEICIKVGFNLSSNGKSLEK